MLLLLFNGGTVIPITPTTYISETWWPGLVSVLQGVCSEATAIIKTSNMNRANWENLLKRGKLQTPYILVESGRARQEDWGRDNIAWRQPVSIHYLTSTTAASAVRSGGGYDSHLWAESRAIDISTNIINYQGTHFHTFNEYPVFSVNEHSPANQVLYSLEAPYIASTVEVELLWGGSNVDGTLWVAS